MEPGCEILEVEQLDSRRIAPEIRDRIRARVNDVARIHLEHDMLWIRLLDQLVERCLSIQSLQIDGVIVVAELETLTRQSLAIGVELLGIPSVVVERDLLVERHQL